MGRRRKKRYIHKIDEKLSDEEYFSRLAMAFIENGIKATKAYVNNHKVRLHENNDNTYIYKVPRSKHRSKKPKYLVTVVMNGNRIQSYYCNCGFNYGYGDCPHIAAVFHKVHPKADFIGLATEIENEFKEDVFCDDYDDLDDDDCNFEFGIEEFYPFDIDEDDLPF